LDDAMSDAGSRAEDVERAWVMMMTTVVMRLRRWNAARARAMDGGDMFRDDDGDGRRRVVVVVAWASWSDVVRDDGGRP
jgi:hypothetical protein